MEALFQLFLSSAFPQSRLLNFPIFATKERMKFLIGIDDTDNLESRGTGWRSRMLAKRLEEENETFVKGITRHQLFVHKDIPYTSHNSSACLEIDSTQTIETLISISREFMLNEAAIGSDVGLCVIEFNRVPEEVENWGKRAKVEVITMKEAYHLSEKYNFYLEGLTGEKCGIIGCLAGIGLRKGGNDGRFLLIGPKDFREYSGIVGVDELKKMSGIEIVCDKENNIFATENERVFVSDWMRPVLKFGVPVLYADKAESGDYEWIAADKEYVKMISN